MGFSIYTKTRSARLTVTTAEGQTVTVENMTANRGFALRFSTTKRMDSSPGESEVTVYNLPDDVLGILEASQTRRIDDPDILLSGIGLQTASVAPDGSSANAAGFLTVELEAGYDGQIGRIFKAIGSRVFSRVDDNLTTTITTIHANENLDGALLGLPQRTFPVGTPTLELLDYLRSLGGLGPGNCTPGTISALLGVSQLSSVYVASGGQAIDRLESVCRSLPIRFFVDDREAWFCGRDGITGPAAPPPWIVEEIQEPEILLRPPQRDDGGRILAECLLCPRLRVGRLVRLTPAGLSSSLQGLSPSIQQIQRARVPPGLYRLDELAHQGDTGGGPWSTRLTLRPTVQPEEA